MSQTELKQNTPTNTPTQNQFVNNSPICELYKARHLILLETAFDLISKVHSQFRYEKNKHTDEILTILQGICKISVEIEKEIFNEQREAD